MPVAVVVAQAVSGGSEVSFDSPMGIYGGLTVG